MIQEKILKFSNVYGGFHWLEGFHFEHYDDFGNFINDLNVLIKKGFIKVRLWCCLQSILNKFVVNFQPTERFKKVRSIKIRDLDLKFLDREKLEYLAKNGYPNLICDL